MHRAPRPWWRVWGPLIAVVILAPLVAFGLVRLAAGGSNEADPTPTVSPTSEQTTTEGETGGEETSAPEGTDPSEGDGASEEPTETATPEPEIDRSVAVSVLNGASVQGLAGRTQEALQALEWTSVTAGNYTSAQPTVSTVFYRDESLRAAAEAVAADLGIEPVTELGDIASITVVLRSDFTE